MSHAPLHREGIAHPESHEQGRGGMPAGWRLASAGRRCPPWMIVLLWTVTTSILPIPLRAEAPAGESVDGVAVPATPAGKAARAWLAAVRTGDSAVLRDLVERWYSLDLVKNGGIEGHVEMLLQIGRDQAGARLVSIETDDSTATFVVGHEETWIRHSLKLDRAGGSRIVSIGARLLSGPPRDLPERASSREDFVEQLSKHIADLVAEDEISGAALVARDGHPIFVEAFGWASKRYGVANGVDTKLNLGSIQKLMTAIAVLRLVSNDLLDLDDLVGEHLPDFPNQAIRDSVQIRHLLAHRGGLGTHFTEEYAEKRRDLYRSFKDYFPLFQEDPLRFEPGRDFAYSNAGYLLLGSIIEAVTGLSYEAYMEQAVYRRAGMEHTGAFDVDTHEPDLATGYYRDTIDTPEGPKRLWLSNAAIVSTRGTPAGGTYSTVGDLSRLVDAFLAGRLVPTEMRELMLTPRSSIPVSNASYGLGVMIRNRESGGVSWGHSGGYVGVNADLRVLPHSDGYDTIIVLANYQGAASRLAREIEAMLPPRQPSTSGHGVRDAWNQLMGPHGDGRIEGLGLFGEDGAFELVPRWRRPLGSGYSDIVTDGAAIFTMSSDGSTDSLQAMSADTGTTLWRYEIGPAYEGHGGSADGPVSTPLVAGDRVFALGPHGELFAVDRSSGTELWRLDLRETHGAEPPPWGFASSPTLAAGLVVLGVGGSDGKSICAFRPDTGKEAWCSGRGKVFYQSPVAATLAGRSLVVAHTNTHMMGLVPETGEVLWSLQTHEDGNSAIARLTQLGASRFLISRRGYYGDFAAYDLLGEGSSWTAVEAWQSPDFGHNYQVPLFHRGHLYGYSGAFLTGVDAESGERLWKSRQPGRGRAILVDGRLVPWTVDGHLHVGRVSPAGYTSEATAQILDAGSYNLPAVGPSRLYVRNLWEIAAVDVAPSSSPEVIEPAAGEPGPGPPELTAGTELGRFLERLGAARDKALLVDELFERHPHMPWIEDDDLVHFLYQGEAGDVAVSGSMAPAGEPMARVAGTDLFYRSFRLPSAGRWEYRFVVDFDQVIADPRNPEAAVGARQPTSQLTMPGWQEPAYLQGPSPGRPGRIVELELESGIAGESRGIAIYLPAGYSDNEKPYPLLVVANGTQAREHGLLARALDHLMPETVRPAGVAFVPFREGPFGIYGESAGAHRGAYVDLLGQELLPFLEGRFRLSERRDDRVLVGTGPGGWASLMAALRHSETYGAAGAQSIDLRLHLRRDLHGALAAGGESLLLYLERSTYESGAPDQDHVPARDHAALAAALEQAGHQVHTERIDAAPGWGTWRTRVHHILGTLLGPPRPEPVREPEIEKRAATPES
ncbi:MAG: serine hydrolase [Holophagales bacterium]|nr:serine hydrolase [Holophagales bacterium]